MTLNEFIQTASLPIAIIVIGLIVLWRVYSNIPEEEASESGGVNQL